MNTNTSISNILHPNKKHKQQIIKNLFTHPNTLPKVIFDHVIILFKELMNEFNRIQFFGDYFGKNDNGYHFGYELIGLVQKQSIICTCCGNYPDKDFFRIYCINCDIFIN
jgi:hypothetical protein